MLKPTQSQSAGLSRRSAGPLGLSLGGRITSTAARQHRHSITTAVVVRAMEIEPVMSEKPKTLLVGVTGVTGR